MNNKELISKYLEPIEILEKNAYNEFFVPENVANEYLNYEMKHLSNYFEEFFDPLEDFEYKMNNIISNTGDNAKLLGIENNICDSVQQLHFINEDICHILYSVKCVEKNESGGYQKLYLTRADYLKFRVVLDLDFEYYYIVCQIKNELNNLYMRCKQSNIRKKAVYDEIKDLYYNIKEDLYSDLIPKSLCKIIPSEFDYRTISKKYKQLSEL